ncbi:hypothetical protein F2S32_15915 [Alistipes onderdonkii]|nr:hypothetical protein F2S32_15915 [Alistipes onderdonkii]
MDQATDGRSGCSRQGAARQAANNRGAVRQVRFYDFTPAGTNSGRGDFCFRLLVRQSLFVDMDAVPGSRMRRPLQQGKDGRVNAAMISAMIPGMISAMTPAMMAHAVMPAPGVSGRIAGGGLHPSSALSAAGAGFSGVKKVFSWR